MPPGKVGVGARFGGEVRNKLSEQSVRRAQLFKVNAPDQIHAVASTRSRNVEALRGRFFGLCVSVSRRNNHRKKHDVTLLPLESSGITEGDVVKLNLFRPANGEE